MQIINIFWIVQFVFLFCYTLAGIWKAIGFGGELLVHDTLANTVLGRSIENDGRYIIWQSAVADYPLLFQIFHVVTVLVQCVSILVFFKPHLIRAYGVLLIFFHFGTSYLMGITFAYHVFAWGLFFVMTPLAPRSTTVRDVFLSMPVLGKALMFIDKMGSTITYRKRSLQATIIYDGECPFCSNYAEYFKLRTVFDELCLINAREQDNPVVIQACSRGFDLDNGMVLVLGDKFYYGGDAMNMIALSSKKDGFLWLLNGALFSNKLVAKAVYPIFKFFRRVTLRVLGVPGIAKI